jgi:PAS domain S-box-containing protein
VIGSRPYLVVPPLVWVAFRFGPRETAWITVLLSVIAIGHTWDSMRRLAGAQLGERAVVAPFVTEATTPNESLLMLQSFVCIIAVTAVALAGAVAERTKAEAALRDSEQRFRTIFEQAAVGVARIETPIGRFRRINQRYCDIVGYSVEEMTSTTFMAITHPEDLEADLGNMKKLVAGEIGEFTMEKRYFHKDGSLVWVNLTVSPTWRSSEKPEYHIAIVEDITRRKQAEAALRESEQHSRSIIDSALDAVVAIDQTGKLIDWNPRPR